MLPLLCRASGRAAAGRRLIVQPVGDRFTINTLTLISRRFLSAAANPIDDSKPQLSRRIAVIGAGQIGTCVAQGLTEAGHQVFVTDPSDTNRSTIEAAGAKWADSKEEVVQPGGEFVDTVVTAVPAPQHIRQVMEGEDPRDPNSYDGKGLLGVLPNGTTWIDHTTTSPEEVRRLTKKASGVGVNLLEVRQARTCMDNH